jgi:hypothetical protein
MGIGIVRNPGDFFQRSGVSIMKIGGAFGPGKDYKVEKPSRRGVS